MMTNFRLSVIYLVVRRPQYDERHVRALPGLLRFHGGVRGAQ